MRGEKPKATKKNYYPAINNFFFFLENKSKKKYLSPLIQEQTIVEKTHSKIGQLLKTKQLN